MGNAHRHPCALGGQNRAPDPLKLELPVVMSCLSMETERRFSERAARPQPLSSLSSLSRTRFDSYTSASRCSLTSVENYPHLGTGQGEVYEDKNLDPMPT